MQALLLVLALCGGDEFRWTVTDRPAFSWSITERGGDPSTASIVVAPQEAVAGPAASDAGATGPVSQTVCRCQGFKKDVCLCLKAGSKCHCSRTSGSVWIPDAGGVLRKTTEKADPRHPLPAQSVASAGETRRNSSPAPGYPVTTVNGRPEWTDSSRNADEPGADTKPRITIRTAPFFCAPCNAVKAMDWSGFDVDWKVGGATRAYPEISWVDARGVPRILTGAYKPWQVEHSWKATQ